MKLVVDEKVKHRFVGIAVIVSIGIVFAPAILKKSQRRFEETVSLSVKLPPKPILPQVSVREPKALFQAVRVAHVEVPSVDKSTLSTSTLAKAEPLSLPTPPPRATVQIDNQRETLQRADKESSPSSPLVQTAKLESVKHIAMLEKASDTTTSQLPSIKPKPVLVQQPALAKQEAVARQQVVAKPGATVAANNAYGVQLATFAIHNNAIALVGKLKNKGYQAQYIKVIGKNGAVYYKVVVGHAKEREQAQRLQKQLAQAVQINGFIVKGIS